MCERERETRKLFTHKGIVRYSKRFGYPRLSKKINKLEVIENKCGSKNGSIKRRTQKNYVV